MVRNRPDVRHDVYRLHFTNQSVMVPYLYHWNTFCLLQYGKSELYKYVVDQKFQRYDAFIFGVFVVAIVLFMPLTGHLHLRSHLVRKILLIRRCGRSLHQE